MASGSADPGPSRPRPRPRRQESDAVDAPEPTSTVADLGSPTSQDGIPSLSGRSPGAGANHEPDRTPVRRGRGRRGGRGLAVPAAPSGQVVAAAGGAIVTAARVGRLLGRSGWRLARQLPGVSVVEQRTTRLRHAATAEFLRLLETPQPSPRPATSEEQRVMMLVQNSGSDPAPLRSAMTELLERSTEADGARSRDYLFGTIVSQLVPDEARILATLAAGPPFAVVDVVVKHGSRSKEHPALSNISTVASAASLSLPDNVGTYLTRLDGYGLLEFGRAGDNLHRQFDALESDPQIRATRARLDRAKQGTPRLVRKTVTLSALGREFWAACAPSTLRDPERPGG